LLGDIPDDELDMRILSDGDREMFFLLAEGLGTHDRDILEEPERMRIPDAVWSESVYDIECIGMDICRREDTLDRECFLREIGDIMDTCDLSIHLFLKCWDSRCLDGESCSLTMPTISHKKFFALIEELDEIAPLRSSTGSDGEFFWDFGFLPTVGEARWGIF